MNYDSFFTGAMAAAFVLVLFFAVAISLLIAIFFLLNLQNLMKEVSPENRKVPHNNVWLMLIPLFNLVYGFILYPQICDSVKAEYTSRNLPEEGDFSRGFAIAMPILALCGFIPILGSLAGVAHLVIFIIFWVKTAGYSSTLKANSVA